MRLYFFFFRQIRAPQIELQYYRLVLNIQCVTFVTSVPLRDPRSCKMAKIRVHDVINPSSISSTQHHSSLMFIFLLFFPAFQTRL